MTTSTGTSSFPSQNGMAAATARQARAAASRKKDNGSRLIFRWRPLFCVISCMGHRNSAETFRFCVRRCRKYITKSKMMLISDIR